MKNKIKNLIEEINNLTYDEYIYLIDDLYNLENAANFVLSNPLYRKCYVCNWVSHDVKEENYYNRCVNCGGWLSTYSEELDNSFKRIEQGIEVDIPEETTPQYFTLDDICPFFSEDTTFRTQCEERPNQLLIVVKNSSKHTFSADILELAQEFKEIRDKKAEEQYQWSLENDVMYQSMELGISGSFK